VQAHDFVGVLQVIRVFLGDTFCGLGNEIATIAAETLIHLRDGIAIATRVVGCIVEALLRTGWVVGEVISDSSSVRCEGGCCEKKDEKL
jgi:hypothetical protein